MSNEPVRNPKSKGTSFPQGAEQPLSLEQRIMRAMHITWDEETEFEVPAEPEPQYFSTLAEAVEFWIKLANLPEQAHAAASQAADAEQDTIMALRELLDEKGIENVGLKAKIAQLEQELNAANKVSDMFRESGKALNRKRVTLERERDQAREALWAVSKESAPQDWPTKLFLQISELEKSYEQYTMSPYTQGWNACVHAAQSLVQEEYIDQQILKPAAVPPSEDAPRFADGLCSKHGDYDARYLRCPKCEEEVGTGVAEDAPATPKHARQPAREEKIERLIEILRDPHLFEGGHLRRAAERILETASPEETLRTCAGCADDMPVRERGGQLYHIYEGESAYGRLCTAHAAASQAAGAQGGDDGPGTNSVDVLGGRADAD